MRLTVATLALALGIAPAAAAQTPFEFVPDERVERTAEHYPETNERRHDVYFDAIEGLGGAFLGVGSDPSYTLAAAAGAELITLVDYDPVVTRLHRALVVLLAGCDDASCLRARLTPAAEERTAERIERALDDDWESARVVRAFRVHRPLLAARMAELAETPSFVSRPDWYAHIHALARRGRIAAWTADLRGPTTLMALAQVARANGHTFRVLYLSNAEEYFSYGDGFLANLVALPTDERTLVLRTFRDQRLPRPDGERAWHYNVQPLPDLLVRIRRGYADSSWLLRDLLAARPDATGISRLDRAIPLVGEAGPRRWWLSDRAAPPPLDRRDGIRSRLLLVAQRAFARRAPRGARAQVRAIDLEDTGVARVGRARLPDEPSGRPPILSGEPGPGAPPMVGSPEHALTAMLLDGLARDVLPALLARAGLDDEAAALTRYPAARDLYAAYRLRERLLEICPPSRRARGEPGRALAACRELTRLVQPVPTTRARPSWEARRGRIGRSLSAFAGQVARLDPGRAGHALVRTLERLARVARALRASSAAARPR